jgi:hypothetical protein
VPVDPLNIRTIKASIKGAAQYVQDEKITISRTTITKQQYAGNWPDEYNSFIGSETRRNLYTDPDKFFRVMHSKPQWYSRKFIFRPIRDTAKEIREATIEANRIVHEQSQKYGVKSGHYGSSFVIMVDRKPITSINQIDSLTGESTVSIVNTAAYASRAEVNALYYSKIGGIIYYAAQVIQRKYKALGVRYVYSKPAFVPGANSIYDVPTLTIGPRSKVIDKLSKPGKALRRRRRSRRS